MTLEKNYKINFFVEKTRPKSVVLQSQKKLQVLEKKFSEKKKKKILQLICADMIFKTVCEFF